MKIKFKLLGIHYLRKQEIKLFKKDKKTKFISGLFMRFPLMIKKKKLLAKSKNANVLFTDSLFKFYFFIIILFTFFNQKKELSQI